MKPYVIYTETVGYDGVHYRIFCVRLSDGTSVRAAEYALGKKVQEIIDSDSGIDVEQTIAIDEKFECLLPKDINLDSEEDIIAAIELRRKS